MKNFEERVSTWLSRTVADRALQQCSDLPAVLSSEVGLQRSENQDRVAAMRLQGARPLTVIAVSDGMGGMRDGGKCAVLAISSFFSALITHGGKDTENRAKAAVLHSNAKVYEYANGRGGATLSAVLINDAPQPFIVNVGDSRIYSFSDGQVERHTVDDSLAEAVGGHGRELIQFIGMGEGIQPHLSFVRSTSRFIALTTDGIHAVAPSVFNSILLEAPSMRAAAERLTALSRWCGGGDNASAAIIDVQSSFHDPKVEPGEGAELWDPFGGLWATWLREPHVCAAEASDSTKTRNLKPDPPEPRDLKAKLSSDEPPRRRLSKKSRKAKKNKEEENQVQLKIQIEQSVDSEDRDENS